jgi:2-hydroxychromene-2-carboxylate isomerase
VRGQSAAIAAGQQDKEFNFIQLLYANQAGENSGWLSDDMVRSAAASIPGLDVEKLLAASDSDAVHAQAKLYVTQATADKLTATPTILVGPSGGTLTKVKLSSPTDFQSVADAIDAAQG